MDWPRLAVKTPQLQGCPSESSEASSRSASCCRKSQAAQKGKLYCQPLQRCQQNSKQEQKIKISSTAPMMTTSRTMKIRNLKNMNFETYSSTTREETREHRIKHQKKQDQSNETLARTRSTRTAATKHETRKHEYAMGSQTHPTSKTIIGQITVSQTEKKQRKTTTDKNRLKSEYFGATSPQPKPSAINRKDFKTNCVKKPSNWHQNAQIASPQ